MTILESNEETFCSNLRSADKSPNLPEKKEKVDFDYRIAFDIIF